MFLCLVHMACCARYLVHVLLNHQHDKSFIKCSKPTLESSKHILIQALKHCNDFAKPMIVNLMKY